MINLEIPNTYTVIILYTCTSVKTLLNTSTICFGPGPCKMHPVINLYFLLDFCSLCISNFSWI